jgi:hypothetical protein
MKMALFALGTITALLAISPAVAKDVVHGKSSLSVMPNLEPCPTDCALGQACHMTISVTGAPAKDLLKTLKEHGVKPDESLKGMGLTIYYSKDGFLSCDTTDGIAPSCAIGFSPPQLKVEPVPMCE